MPEPGTLLVRGVGENMPEELVKDNGPPVLKEECDTPVAPVEYGPVRGAEDDVPVCDPVGL